MQKKERGLDAKEVRSRSENISHPRRSQLRSLIGGVGEATWMPCWQSVRGARKVFDA
jgi:hypothetical protein